MPAVSLPDFSEWLDRGDNFQQEEDAWELEGDHGRLADLVLAEMEAVGATSVIEVGCGTGRLAAALLRTTPTLDYIGLDKNLRCVKAARDRLTDTAGRVIHADVRGARFEHVPGRMVVSIAVLKHFGLSEWGDIVAWICGWGDHVFLNYQERDDPLDDGTEFPHVWVTGDMMRAALARGGIEPSRSIFIRSNEIGADYIATGSRVADG